MLRKGKREGMLQTFFSHARPAHCLQACSIGICHLQCKLLANTTVARGHVRHFVLNN
jgi:hypothetical protein